MHSLHSALVVLVATGIGAAAATAAETSNTASYPLTTCIVSGETLGDEAVTKVYGDREVRFCGERCMTEFEKNESEFLDALDAAIVEQQMESYPLEKCVVSGQVLGGMGEPVNLVVGNRLVRLCCENCAKDLEADPALYVADLDAAVVEAQVDGYPADTCPISGGKLGSMGDPYDYVFAGQLVRFCCGGCIGAFDENPTAMMATIHRDGDEANEADPHAGHGH